MNWFFQSVLSFCLFWLILQAFQTLFGKSRKKVWLFALGIGLVYLLYCTKIKTNPLTGLIALITATGATSNLKTQTLNSTVNSNEATRNPPRSGCSNTNDLNGTLCQRCYYLSEDYYIFPCSLHPGKTRTKCLDFSPSRNQQN